MIGEWHRRCGCWERVTSSRRRSERDLRIDRSAREGWRGGRGGVFAGAFLCCYCGWGVGWATGLNWGERVADWCGLAERGVTECLCKRGEGLWNGHGWGEEKREDGTENQRGDKCNVWNFPSTLVRNIYTGSTELTSTRTSSASLHSRRIACLSKSNRLFAGFFFSGRCQSPASRRVVATPMGTLRCPNGRFHSPGAKIPPTDRSPRGHYVTLSSLKKKSVQHAYRSSFHALPLLSLLSTKWNFISDLSGALPV